VSSQRFTQVDAFTNRPFAGNPAAVCLLPSPRDSKWMQHVAQEMNLAETAFLVHLPASQPARFHTRSGVLTASRDGAVRVRLEGDRAHLGGHAVTVLRGELLH
jgi:predicted PhzF superfamily epimerase YddE/YHI9